MSKFAEDSEQKCTLLSEISARTLCAYSSPSQVWMYVLWVSAGRMTSTSYNEHKEEQIWARIADVAGHPQISTDASRMSQAHEVH